MKLQEKAQIKFSDLETVFSMGWCIFLGTFHREGVFAGGVVLQGELYSGG